jgi:superfamily II DNA or RNA helicase
MKLKLEPYQQQMVDHLLANDRAYASVGLGLGKTASTLSALNTLFQEGAIGSALIVAPKRVARMTWPNEIEKWDQFKWMKIEHLMDGDPSGDAQIYLINYDRLDRLRSLDFCDVVVFDEITKAKNPQSKRINALRPLFGDQMRWGLTGTPRPNSLLELFGQIRLLDDGARLGRSFNGYRDTYFYPTDYMRYNWAPKPTAESKVYDKISDLTVTLRSSDYLDVADTVLEDIEITMSPVAQDAYKELEEEFLVQTDSGEVVARNAAVLAGKLHQMAGGNAYNDDRTVAEIHDGKIVWLEKLVRDLKEPLLVASNYVHERERICAAIPGAVDAAKFKGDIEKAWNTGQIPMLVADPRSMGHGLNLQQGGRIIVWYSPTWSRELYDQFNARLARKGQTQQPLIYRILAKGTIDEAIVETLRERGDAQHEMLRVMANYRKMVSCPSAAAG